VNPPNDCATIANRVDDLASVFGQAGDFVVAGQVYGDRLVPSIFKQRDDAMPVPGDTTGTRDQNEGAHERLPGSGDQMWDMTILHGGSPKMLGLPLRSRNRTLCADYRTATLSAKGLEDPLSPVRRCSE
jgi:hypothetical protein